jgi:hypothetical protein
VTPGAKELVFNCWSSTLTAAACAAASLFFLHRRRARTQNIRVSP